MEKSFSVRFEELGGRVASVWEGLRPSTRGLVERALQSAPAPGQSQPRAAYDARSEWELSRLLAALDDRAGEAGQQDLSAEQSSELFRMADACAFVLCSEARTAEIFAQLLERSLRARDYARVDKIADTITARLAPSEICELARNAAPALRAIAHESLAQKPTGVLIDLLSDPVDAHVARHALEIQADDYGSEEAGWVVNTLERVDESDEA